MSDANDEAVGQGRMSQEKADESCRKLLETCVRHFAKGQSVVFKDVSALYGDPNEFYRDCRRIKATLDRLRPWFDLLGISLPLVEYGNGEFRIRIRGFAARMEP